MALFFRDLFFMHEHFIHKALRIKVRESFLKDEQEQDKFL